MRNCTNTLDLRPNQSTASSVVSASVTLDAEVIKQRLTGGMTWVWPEAILCELSTNNYIN
jgi:hypothetical protein